MFLDQKELLIRAGKGGDGVALFRREIYVPKGGPDGGDGGDGGDVRIVGRSNLHALTGLAHIEKVEAEDGKKGSHRRSTGRSGIDSEIAVPLGTVVEVRDGEEWNQIDEITREGQSLVIARGGSGGWGNWHFRSSIQQAPERWNPGLPGEEKRIRLTLKLIADIGLIGLPNAGKSTFLSVVSAAKPKIADYPFTTLEPQLGVAELGSGDERRHLVIADLPGLIEGASQGKGLGAAFLKHIERTRLLFHFVDCTLPLEEIERQYHLIRKELAGWSEALSRKKELLVLSKADTLPAEEAAGKRAEAARRLGIPVYLISSAAHAGVKELLEQALKIDSEPGI